MPWYVEFHNDQGIVETIYEGLLSPIELQAAIGAALAVGREKAATRYLSDCLRMEGGHSIVDLSKMVDLIDGQGVSRSVRVAVLFAPESDVTEMVKFWKTCAGNRGFKVQLFLERESALTWLLSAPPFRSEAGAGLRRD